MTDETLDRALDALPRAIDPARDLWPGIRARIGAAVRSPSAAEGPFGSLIPPRSPAEPSAALGSQTPPRSPAGASASPAWPPWLRAAAMLVTAVGAGAGVLAVRGVPERPVAIASRDAAPVRLASDVDDLFARYDAAAAELAAAFAARRPALDAETAAVVDRALRAIDTAIADLRTALGRRPDAAARQLLEAAYRQKVDLLGRALRL